MAPGGDREAGALGADAAQGDDGAVVTLRQLPQELLGDPLFLRRFRTETPIVAHLDGTYVVRTRAYVEDAFGTSLVTDYVEGCCLRRLVEVGTVRDPETALVVLRDALLGLEAAHREGILHRDLRPEKILVDRDGVARVMDLGLVARTAEGRWIAGTPEYMAPELWQGEEATIESDVYAAAVVLVECLTGSPPYLGGPAVLRDQHLRAPLPGPELLPEVAPLVRFGMAKSPHQRYLRAWDFAEAVEGAGRTVGGPHWERRGRRRLATAVALELAQLPGHDASEPHRGLIGRARFRRRSRTQP
ncbi:MAG: serine/threonine-protein kinase [Candidatus Dormibacteria bacterium]